MAKILISDLIGTLIPSSINEAESLYYEGNHKHNDEELDSDKEYRKKLMDKIFIQLGKQLNKFLSDGNYIKLVTSIDSHDPADFMFNQLITRFYKNIEEYKNQVTVFLVGKEDNLRDLSKVATIVQRDSITYAENEDGISVIFIDDKTKVFDFVKKEHNLVTDRFYAIGDSDNDIPMLFKCIQLGGKSSLINNYLHCIDNQKKTTGKIIMEKATHNFNNKLEQLYPDLKKMPHQEQILLKEKLWSEWISTELNRLYTLLFNGELDLDQLLKEQEIYKVLREYSEDWSASHERDKRKAACMENMEKLTMYPTFADYNSKVLMIKKN